ncbi:hypothetical protein JD844_005705 [Phrynosoma platyrhinos]|uniref:Uncharacterized protein n=1 Tax=Phrynosoma platyrhinos TaxID=52577 RepID=A0ABQ7TPI5_PHRPL|nr:hypothetical protein JD844_005705 [Phrynosoma platyrhinos]
MPPANMEWIRVKLPYRATTASSTCISFLLLSVSLLSPSWMEIIVPETSISSSPVVNKLCNKVVCSQLDGSSDFMKASRIFLTLATIAGFIAAFSLLISCRCLRCCGGSSNMLISSVASFTTGVFGFVTMVLYTVDITNEEMSSVGHLHFTWSFCLAWMVFTLYIMNGFFSLMTHLLSVSSASERHTGPMLLEGGVQQLASGDHTTVRLSVPPGQETATTPARSLFPGPSICLNSTII